MKGGVLKRFKIIACFLLMFSLTLSEENSVVAEQKARITQLEQQIETQNKIIARYERLEDKLNDRILENLDLNNKVDDFYNSAWTKLLVVITGAFAGIGLLLPYLQNKSFRETKEKIENQEKAFETYVDTKNQELERILKQLKNQEEDNFKKDKEIKKIDFQMSKEQFYQDIKGNDEISLYSSSTSLCIKGLVYLKSVLNSNDSEEIKEKSIFRVGHDLSDAYLNISKKGFKLLDCHFKELVDYETLIEELIEKMKVRKEYFVLIDNLSAFLKKKN